MSILDKHNILPPFKRLNTTCSYTHNLSTFPHLRLDFLCKIYQKVANFIHFCHFF